MKIFSAQRNILGESPLWDPFAQTLWWVDIHAKQILRRPWDRRETEIFQFERRPTAIGQIDRSRFIVAFEDALFEWSPAGGLKNLECGLPKRPHHRTNDGKVGPDGRFWFGTMDDNELLNTGALYSFSVDGVLNTHAEGIGIANTFAWSPEGDTMYFADSKAQKIFKIPFQDGVLGELSTFVDLSETSYYPDGSCVDETGCLWNAQWDGSRVRKYSPQGALQDELILPVTRPTSCCFGGPKGEHLFITTASVGLNTQAEPLAGQVFVTETSFKGTPITSWGMRRSPKHSVRSAHSPK